MNKIVYKLPLIIFGIFLVFTIFLSIVIYTDKVVSDDKNNSINDHSSLTVKQRASLLKMINEQNKDLPRPFGAIGQLDKISFESDTITSYYSLQGLPEVDSTYENSLNEIKSIILSNFFHILNGEKNYGNEFANFMKKYGIHLKSYIRTPSGRIFEILIKDYEPREYLDLITQSPASALRNLLVSQLKLIGSQLPLDLNTNQKLTNITQLSSQAAALDSTNILLDISSDKNSVRYRYLVSDTENVFELYKPHLNDSQFCKSVAKLLSDDLSTKELMRIMALCNIDYELRYIRSDWKDSITVYIPSYILKETLGL